MKKKISMKANEEVTSNNWWHSKCILISDYILTYWFYIHIILAISIAIVQLRFSIVYDNHCTIDDRIILYLFIMGIIQLGYSLNGILIIFSLLYNKYRYIVPFLSICFGIFQLLVIFLIIWFIIGNYLVFRVEHEVQHINTYHTGTYCHYALYKTAYWTIIIYYIFIIFSFFLLIFKNIKWFFTRIKSFKTYYFNDSSDHTITNSFNKT